MFLKYDTSTIHDIYISRYEGQLTNCQQNKGEKNYWKAESDDTFIECLVKEMILKQLIEKCQIVTTIAPEITSREKKQ